MEVEDGLLLSQLGNNFCANSFNTFEFELQVNSGY